MAQYYDIRRGSDQNSPLEDPRADLSGFEESPDDSDMPDWMSADIRRITNARYRSLILLNNGSRLT